jgi:hypothetical protein
MRFTANDSSTGSFVAVGDLAELSSSPISFRRYLAWANGIHRPQNGLRDQPRLLPRDEVAAAACGHKLATWIGLHQRTPQRPVKTNIRERRKYGVYRPNHSELPPLQDVAHGGVNEDHPGNPLGICLRERVQDQGAQTRADEDRGRFQLKRLEHRCKIGGQAVNGRGRRSSLLAP